MERVRACEVPEEEVEEDEEDEQVVEATCEMFPLITADAAAVVIAVVDAAPTALVSAEDDAADASSPTTTGKCSEAVGGSGVDLRCRGSCCCGCCCLLCERKGVSLICLSFTAGVGVAVVVDESLVVVAVATTLMPNSFSRALACAGVTEGRRHSPSGFPSSASSTHEGFRAREGSPAALAAANVEECGASKQEVLRILDDAEEEKAAATEEATEEEDRRDGIAFVGGEKVDDDLRS